MSFLSSLGKIAHAIVKSPITKVVAGGVAVVFPPAGIPALAGIAAAERIVDATDQGAALVNQVKAGVSHPQIPGGRVPVEGVIARMNNGNSVAKQALNAARIVRNTQALAKGGDADARHALQVLRVVKAAKEGKPAAVASLHGYIRKQVAATLIAGKDPHASPEQKQAARLVSGLIKGTAARKKASRHYGVDRRTARVVRVA